MSKQSSEESDDRLVELALRLDDLLKEDLAPESLDASLAGELSDEQLAELKRASDALGFLNNLRRNLHAASPSDAPATPNLARDATFSPGAMPLTESDTPTRIGRFEILDVLGQGGFSRVFLARDPELDRRVALKIPLPQTLTDDSSRKRFEREAKAAAVLSHPAIIPIFETGSVGPISYIAFGYCPGLTLGQWFQSLNGNCPVRTAAAIIAKLAEAVGYAHQRGIVHRDLKPGNVLVEFEEDIPISVEDESAELMAERVRIADFGLARMEFDVNESLTIEGAVVGTPAYMSPEQARGAAKPDRASDIFSLGTMLYELLTGIRPFQAKTQLATLRDRGDRPNPTAQSETRSGQGPRSDLSQMPQEAAPGTL